MSEIISIDSQVTSHPSGVTLWNGKRYVMITLVSNQTMPNIIPVFQKGAPVFDKIYFLHTDQYSDQFKWASEVITDEKKGLPTEPVWYDKEVDNGDYEVTQNIAEELITLLEDEATQGQYEVKVVCNWTLGTKPMSVGLVNAARKHTCATIYVDTQNGRILDPTHIFLGEQRDKKYDLNLTVKQYLQAHGLEAKTPSNPEPLWMKAAMCIQQHLDQPYGAKSHSLDLYDTATKDKEDKFTFFPAIRLNLQLLSEKTNGAQKRVNREKAKFLQVTAQIGAATNLSEALRPYKLIANISLTPDNSMVEIELVSTNALRFLNGFWLEYYVYGKLREISDNDGSGLDSRVAQGVEFYLPNTQDKPVPNELDILFTKGAEIAYISCKTGNFYRFAANTEEVYKLETVAKSGGIFSKKVLIFTLPEEAVNPDLKARAKTLNFKLFYLEDLSDIANKIEQLF